jgi:16S rRNA (guanine527-N7)-methyltransferase
MTVTQNSLDALSVSRETIGRLEHLIVLLEKWNPTINLVARSTLADSWSRHIIDSAQIYSLAPRITRHWADLGSGGGFPGLVIAILADELQPSMKVTLIEADKRKATFLRQASQSLGISASVLPLRIESVQPLDADVVSARALAPLRSLCGFAKLHCGVNGVALFLKGANHASEIAEAERLWAMDLVIHPSATDPRSVILELKGVSHG